MSPMSERCRGIPLGRSRQRQVVRNKGIVPPLFKRDDAPTPGPPLIREARRAPAARSQTLWSDRPPVVASPPK